MLAVAPPPKPMPGGEADVAELADALVSGTSGGNPLEVRLLSSAIEITHRFGRPIPTPIRPQFSIAALFRSIVRFLEPWRNEAGPVRLSNLHLPDARARLRVHPPPAF